MNVRRAWAALTAAVVGLSMSPLVAVSPAQAAGPCTTISPLDCSEVPVDLPFSLTFDGTEGGIVDSAGDETGFTMVDTPSATLTSPSVPALPGYEPSLLDVDPDAGALTITSTKGIQYRDPSSSSGTNSLVNGLGVGVDPTEGLEISTTMEPIDFAASPTRKGQQAGLWFGLDEDTYAKLVLLKVSDTSAQVELSVEVDGGSITSASNAPESVTSPPFDYSPASSSAATLTLTVDPVEEKVTGNIELDGTSTQVGGGLAVPQELLAAGPSGAPYVGVFASHRRAGDTESIAATFTDFSVVSTAADTTVPSTPDNVTASVSGNDVSLTWDSSTDDSGIAGYTVYRSDRSDFQAGPQTAVGDTAANQTEFVDTDVPEGLWFYRVAATDGAGLVGFGSDPAAPATVSALDATPELRADRPSIRVRAEQGGLGTATFVVVESTGAQTPMQVAVDADWLDVDGTFTTPAELQVIANATGLEPGLYDSVVTISSPGYPNLDVAVQLEVLTPPPPLSLKVNFQPAGSAVPSGYLRDSGDAFGLRSGTDQGNGQRVYGWVTTEDSEPTDRTGDTRDRARPGVPPELDTVMHMQTGAEDASWELAVPEGVFQVTVASGDKSFGGGYDSVHALNVEDAVAIESFNGSGAKEYQVSTVTVGVSDGRLTISPTGGQNTKINYLEVVQVEATPHVTAVAPGNRATGVGLSDGLAADIRVPGAGVGVDPSTLDGNVTLVDVATGASVTASTGSSGGNDVITLSPDDPLIPFSTYRFVISENVLAEDGTPFAPFTSVFTTGAGTIDPPDSSAFSPLVDVAFTKLRQTAADGDYITSMVFGPDGRLYTPTIGAGIFRYDVAEDGSLSNKTAVGPPAILGRAVIGLVFDETSTATDLRAWITHSTSELANETAEWGSKVSHLSGASLGTIRDVFVNLPRSQKDHLTNSIAYGPDGNLMVLQGSNQAAGDYDSSWGDRGEKLLSAALLTFSPSHSAVAAAVAGTSGPVNVQTSGVAQPYDPFADAAPLTIYASGIRNAYDMVYSSSGHLLVPTNGTAGGGNSPGVDVRPNSGIPTEARRTGQLSANYTTACLTKRVDGRPYTGGDVPAVTGHTTQPDHLYTVVKGGYYGHPNPERCEWVLHSGNPTRGNDPYEKPDGSDYPVGVDPDPNYRGFTYTFGFNKSPNGVIEYTSDAFGGQLKGWVIVTRFSNNNDLVFLQIDPDTGGVIGAQDQNGITGVARSTIQGVGGFDDPLDVVEDPKTGNLYVNEYDRGGSDPALYLLKVSEPDPTIVDAQINFQQESLPTPPGWLADTGQPFDVSGGYGWLVGGNPADRSDETRTRPVPNDDLLRSLIHVQSGGPPGVWEYAVPNGSFEVEVSAGDGKFTNSTHSVRVEGTDVISGFSPSNGSMFASGSATVTVSDGRLTVEPGPGGSNTKLNYVRIRSAIDIGEPEIGDTVRVNYQTAAASAPAGWIQDTGSAFSGSPGYGWLVDGSPANRSSAARTRSLPPGDVLLQSLTHLGTGPGEATWEYNVPDGRYAVDVSVGDGQFADSTHSVEVEGSLLVDGFTPTAPGDFRQAGAIVDVTDGRLTVREGSGGDNTKLNWITFTFLEPAVDTTPPVIETSLSGPEVSPGEFGGSVTLTVSARDSGSGVEFLEYSVNGANPVAYFEPIVIDELGTYDIEIRAVDGAGNSATASASFTVVEPGDATIALINEDGTQRFDKQVHPGFFNNWLTMSRIGGNLDTTPPGIHLFHDWAELFIENSGAGDPLVVTDLQIRPSGEFVLEEVPELPLVIPAGERRLIKVRFVADSGAKGVRSAELAIANSDPVNPEAVVQLRGVYQPAPEGKNEVDIREMVASFGYTTDMGTNPLTEENSSPLAGEEHRSKFWTRANPAEPLVSIQLAAYHGCFSSNGINVAGASVSHNANFCQSVLPAQSGSAYKLNAELVTSPTGQFAINSAGYSTNTNGNLGVRTWPVRDPDGRLVPNTWLVIQDFVANGCGSGTANCDYNDNIFVVSNITPVTTGSQAPGAPTGLAGTHDPETDVVSLTWDAGDETTVGYHVERATDPGGPWTRLKASAQTQTTLTDPAAPSGAVWYRVLAVGPTGALSKASESVSVDVPAREPSEPQPATEFTYEPIADQPFDVTEAQGLVLNGQLYSFGGFDSQRSGFTPTERSYRYDPGTDSWTRIADLPFLAGNGEAGTGATHVGVATDGEDIYLAGGFISNGGAGQTFGTKEVYRYDVSEDSYDRLPDLPEDRSTGVLAHLDGRLHYISGSNKARTAEPTDHWVLNLSSPASGWSTAAPLPEGRNHPGYAVLGGKIYFVAGQTGHDAPSLAYDEMWSYDPVTDSWSEQAPVPQTVNHAVNSTFVLDGRIIVAGGKTCPLVNGEVPDSGCSGSHGNLTDKVFAYDPSSDTWAELTSLPAPRFGGVAGAFQGGFLFSGGAIKGQGPSQEGVRAVPVTP